MNQTKGFLTIATGKEEYYQLANNLLHSYHYFCKERLPFTILADRKNEYTAEFDNVLILEGVTNSYLDKLRLSEYLPYDINIFIDSDCLAFDDLNQIFDYFEDADDFSCFGRVLSLDDTTGWFEYKNMGDLKPRLSYVVGLHGGIYYMRQSKICQKVLKSAQSMVSDYSKFKFKGKFDTPGDEPLVALAMALNGCRPIPFQKKVICCYWEYIDNIKIDIEKGVAAIEGNYKKKTMLLHWGTRYTRQLQYQKQVSVLNILQDNDINKGKRVKLCKCKFDFLIMLDKVRMLAIRVKSKLLRITG